MGKLIYGDSGLSIQLDDRTLAHLQVVISDKLRRHEGFFLSWRDDQAVGEGRSSIWMHRGIMMFFKYSSPTRHALNREWLMELARSANTPQGLLLTAEPGESESRPVSRV